MNVTLLPSGKSIATIEGDTHIGKWAIEAGRLDHDQNMLPLLRPYIPEGGAVIDIGAYIGDHTVFYAECVGDFGWVYAFEPNSDAFDCLEYNTADLGNVFAVKVGVSDRASSIGLAISVNGGATYATPDGNLPCIDIDSFAPLWVDFIKMDCEGMEPKALKGAEKTILTYLPTMLIEINRAALERQGETESTIFAMLDAWGYSYRNIYAEQPMKGEQYDILCTPPAR